MDNIVEIISIFMSAVVTLAVCLINNKYQQNKTIREVSERHDKEFQDFKDAHSKDINDIKLMLSEMRAEDQNHIAVLTERVDVLSTRVEKHNNVMEKVYELQTLAVKFGEIQKRADERIDSNEHRIEKLEDAV